MKLFTVSSCLIVFCLLVSAAPVDDNSENNENDDDSKDDSPPHPYHYKYTVKDEEKQLFFDKTESGDESGKVTGKYSVLQADGR